MESNLFFPITYPINSVSWENPINTTSFKNINIDPFYVNLSQNKLC